MLPYGTSSSRYGNARRRKPTAGSYMSSTLEETFLNSSSAIRSAGHNLDRDSMLGRYVAVLYRGRDPRHGHPSMRHRVRCWANVAHDIRQARTLSHTLPHIHSAAATVPPLWNGKRAPHRDFWFVGMDKTVYGTITVLPCRILVALISYCTRAFNHRLPHSNPVRHCVNMMETRSQQGGRKKFDAGQALSAQAVHVRKTKVGSSLCFLPRFYAFLRVEYAVPVSPFPR